MLNILDFLDFFGFIRGNPAAVIVVLTAAIIFLVRSWKLALIALLIQYLVSGLLLADVLLPHLAFTFVLMGLFIVLMLSFTSSQVDWGRLPADITAEEAQQLRSERVYQVGRFKLSADSAIKLGLAIGTALVAIGIYQRQVLLLPLSPQHLSLAAIGMAAFGIVGMSLTTEPLKAGLGLLTFLTGFQIFFSAFEQSMALLVMLIAANLVLTLAISYLVQLRHDYQALLD